MLFGGVVAWFYRRDRRRVFVVMAAAVFSHWLLDLVVHVPDLPLWADRIKVGLGLWRWAWISVPLEIVTLLAGAWVYVRYLPARRGGNLWLCLFVAAMSALELYNQFGPPPPDARTMAIMALAAYGVLAGLAALVDRTRAPQTTAEPAGRAKLPRAATA